MQERAILVTLVQSFKLKKSTKLVLCSNVSADLVMLANEAGYASHPRFCQINETVKSIFFGMIGDFGN